MRVRVSSDDGVEAAQMRASLPHGTSTLCRTFEEAPYDALLVPREVSGKTWRFEVLDVFGNRTEAVRRIETTR